ncbi:hypothetical protein EBU99_04930 [bacterium]|nr:hypothetical protein [bacterium]
MGEQFALKNNQIFVLAEAAGGVYNSDQLRVLCEVADNESAFLKITEDQRIGFMVDPSRLADVQSQVRKSGLLLRSYKSAGVPSPRACLGELCTFAHQPSLGDALELTTHLLKSFPVPKRFSSIGVNGCQRACLGSSTEDIHVVGEESGYKISIGGKGADIPQQAQLILENVTRADLPIVIEKILAVFYQESQEFERIYDVIDRIGLTPFFNALPEHLIPVHNEPDSASFEATDPATESATTDELTLPEAANADDTGLVQVDTTDALLDDLLESSSAELGSDALAQTAASSDVIPTLDEQEPLVDISADDISPEVEASEASLLEEAELEDATSDDVERVRDAIRTELSMSEESNIRAVGNHTADLLDEIPDDSSFDALSSSDEGSAINDPSLATDIESDSDTQVSAEFDTDDLALEASYDSQNEEEAAAEFEQQRPKQNKRMNLGKPDSGSRDPKHKTERQAKTSRQKDELALPVTGRLAIRFLGEQLAVELPSGMCFELPFDAVPQGAEFSMVLPDGELRLERDGDMLAVSLGLLNMRLPIPHMEQKQVA